ncbi:MAG: hypothetical protein PHT59_05830, partial [Candidatus Omnitrophica bacterium]|nr:hypothetical protein [Candidatus Omnitrophota bacterium]
GNTDATKSIKIIASYLADAVIEGRKRFVSYLSHEGVAMEKGEGAQPAGILPEEEAGIKEIEEIVETEKKDDGKAPLKHGHTAAAAGDRARGKRKAP